MASRSGNDLLYDRVLDELKRINKKLDRKYGIHCRNCYTKSRTIKQLKVEKAAFLKYIKELEGFMRIKE